ncbi:MAG: LysR substrate-binding domain-containing protein [Steroidobacteraceae bacterium]
MPPGRTFQKSLDATGIHAALRTGDGQWKGLHVELLLDEWLVPVCHPDLLQKLGPVSNHADLARYPLLRSTTEPWTDWPSGDAQTGWPDSGLGLDDSTAIVRLAATGVGLALARWSLVADEVSRGHLAVASRHIARFARKNYFVCPPKLRHLKKVVAFRDWIFGQAGNFPAPPGATIR